MATASIGENHWRILRDLLKRPKKTATFSQLRGWTRADSVRFQFLLLSGAVTRDLDKFTLTKKGEEMADTGLMDLEEMTKIRKGVKPKLSNAQMRLWLQNTVNDPIPEPAPPRPGVKAKK